mmetsp:Transcript_4321/g.27517  ORF Transcript_4321/g.27517 Transcript_4321/m.27517 type:complete len:223 (-) Transcript_4321:33-701(-)
MTVSWVSVEDIMTTGICFHFSSLAILIRTSVPLISGMRMSVSTRSNLSLSCSSFESASLPSLAVETMTTSIQTSAECTPRQPCLAATTAQLVLSLDALSFSATFALELRVLGTFPFFLVVALWTTLPLPNVTDFTSFSSFVCAAPTFVSALCKQRLDHCKGSRVIFDQQDLHGLDGFPRFFFFGGVLTMDDAWTGRALHVSMVPPLCLCEQSLLSWNEPTWC